VVLQWNLASNSALEPHTPGGCTQCLGAVTIDGDGFVRNPAYYVIAHASKFVLPGSVRIESNSFADLPNVAFKRPDGKVVVIVLNNTDSSKVFNVNNGTVTLTSTLMAGAVATYIWN
jgi:glucosylceramidase